MKNLIDSSTPLRMTTEFTRLEKMFLLSLKPLVEKHQISDETAFILSTTKGNISLLKTRNFTGRRFSFQLSSKNC
jgi:hypothetical protein